MFKDVGTLVEAEKQGRTSKKGKKALVSTPGEGEPASAESSDGDELATKDQTKAVTDEEQEGEGEGQEEEEWMYWTLTRSWKASTRKLNPKRAHRRLLQAPTGQGSPNFRYF